LIFDSRYRFSPQTKQLIARELAERRVGANSGGASQDLKRAHPARLSLSNQSDISGLATSALQDGSITVVPLQSSTSQSRMVTNQGVVGHSRTVSQDSRSAALGTLQMSSLSSFIVLSGEV